MEITRQDSFRETPEVRALLVADLAYSLIPTSIMGVTLVGVSLFVHAAIGADLLLAAAIWGGLACLGKLVLMAVQVRMARTGIPDARMTARFEAAHLIVTVGMASAVGAVAFVVFHQSDIQLQLLATGMLFGYGSGVVARVSVRPGIAITSLLVAGVPAVVAAALWDDTPHRVIALTFLVFLIGSFESVRHAHSTAVRHVAMRIEMARLARNDPLTGLENRLGLRRAFARHETETDPLVAIHCLDLDGFKGINDRFGHAAGDAVLAEVARRLVAAVPADATVARMGGDEFVVLQRAVRRPEEAEDLAARIHVQLREPMRIDGRGLSVGVSLGYAVAGAHGAQLEDLLRRADEASYRVKRAGGGVSAEAVTPAPRLRDVA